MSKQNITPKPVFWILFAIYNLVFVALVLKGLEFIFVTGFHDFLAIIVYLIWAVIYFYFVLYKAKTFRLILVNGWKFLLTKEAMTNE